MSPDIPLKILEWSFSLGPLGFLIGLMLLYAIYRGWLYASLLSDKHAEHQKVFEQARQLIRSEHWGTRYRLFLHKILAKLTRFIGDHERFPDKKPVFRDGFPVASKIQGRAVLCGAFQVNPFTIESYQFCFLFACFYPIFSFFVGWAIGGDGALGTLEVFSDDVHHFKRWGVLASLSFSIVLVVWSQKFSGLKFFFVNLASLYIAAIVGISGFGTFAFALAGAVTFAVGVVFFAGAAALSNANSVVFTGAGAAASASAFVAAGAIAVTLQGVDVGALDIAFALISSWLIVFWLYKKALQKGELAAYWFIYSLLFFTGSLAGLVWIENAIAVSVLLFYLILPLVNTPLDWLSLGITRALLQSIRFNQHRFTQAFFWGVLDLGLALIALLLVSGATVSVISMANLLAIKPIIDLQALFNSLGNLDNWQDNLWIYFMLLSTLIPTAVHFALAGGALTLAVSNQKRAAILEDLENHSVSAKKAWIYISVMPAFGFVLAPAVLIYSLYYLLSTHGAWLGNGLLAWVKMLAMAIDPTLGQ